MYNKSKRVIFEFLGDNSDILVLLIVIIVLTAIIGLSIYKVSNDWSAAEAIGSLAAFFAAIFLPGILSYVRRPKLEILEFDNTTTEIVKIPTKKTLVLKTDKRTQGIESDVYYIRMRVKNQGKTKAENVEVYLYELLEKGSSGYSKVNSFLPMNLEWAHRDFVLPVIPPGTIRFCAIAAIFDPQKRKWFDNETPVGERWKRLENLEYTTILSMRTKPRTLRKEYLQPPGTYKLKLELSASNAKPIKREIILHLDGQWFDNPKKMSMEGVRIKLY